MAGIHRLEHVQRFRATDLADDDAIGAHAQCVDHQIARENPAASLDIHRPRLHPDDVLLVQRDLRRNGWDVEWLRVETPEALREALRSPWHVILSDYAMPAVSALQVLEMVHASEQADIPVIVVSGSIGEEKAIEVLRRGAADYVNKQALARLSPAIPPSLRRRR